MDSLRTGKIYFTLNSFLILNYFQCWVILVRVGQSWVPGGWFLLPNKDSNTYKAVLLWLKDVKEVPAPETVHLDFEAGEHKAFATVYPTTAITGCDFHWKQVINLGCYIFLLFFG